MKTERETCSSALNHSPGSSAEKKLKLFGFELNPSKNDNVFSSAEAADDCVNSSNPSVSAKKEISGDHSTASEEKRFECRYCFKEFANSQALGGHQNAHKKERMKKKRLQLQSRRANLNCYLQPLPNNGATAAGRWFYDNLSCFPYEEPNQISFERFRSGSQQNQMIVFRQDSVGFERNYSESLAAPTKSCKTVDLQLGLDMQPTI